MVKPGAVSNDSMDSGMKSQPAQAPASRTQFSGTNQPAFSASRPRHGGTLRTSCPHCRCFAKVRSSETITALVKELRYQCTNLDCGHTFVASLTIDRTVVQSAMPNPRIRLPVGQPRKPAEP